MRKVIQITKDKWSALETYLFIDLKLADDQRNRQGHRSRYYLLCNFFKDKEFNRDNFNLLMNEMHKKGYSANYLNNIIKLAKHIDKHFGYNCLGDYTYFDRPTHHYVDIFTPEEIKKIAYYYYPYKTRHGKTIEDSNLKYKTIYLFLGVTGCRIGELMLLKWNDYFGDYVIFRTTKNGDERVCPIPLFVQRLIDKLPRESDLVFNAFHLSTINNDLKNRCEHLGINKQAVHCHIFRHSFITQLIKSNAPLPSIAKLVGHRDLSSTQIYSHMLIDDMRLAQVMHPLCREEATLESLAKKIREFTESLVDRDKYVIQITEGVDFRLKLAHK